MLVGVGLSILFFNLGAWQLSRLDERRASNALIEARIVGEPREFEALVGQYGMDPDELNYRRAMVTGRYLIDDEIFSVGRNYDGVTGTLALTPLELSDGSIMIIVRGLVPIGTDGPPATGFETPSGTVTLTGRLDDGEEPLKIGEPPPVDGVIEGISRVDLAYIDQYYGKDVLPVNLILESQQPQNTGEEPFRVPAPELTEGRHLGYAVQWFAFSLLALVGAAVLVWRAGTERPTSETEMETTSPR